MFRFVAIIPLEFLAIVLLLLLLWTVFGLGGLIFTTLGLMLLQAGALPVVGPMPASPSHDCESDYYFRNGK